MNLSKNVHFEVVLDTTAAGTGDTLSSAIIDMAGYDGVVFMALTGAVLATAVGTLTVQQDELNGAGGMATLSGDAVTFTDVAAEKSSTIMFIDVYRPTKRYLRAQFQRQTANIEVDKIIAMRYCSSSGPVTQSADVVDSALMVSPAEV